MSDKGRVLIVDDDPFWLRLLEQRLAKRGYQIEKAANAHDALGLAAVFRPQVIITDLMMPGMDGTEFCQQLRANSTLGPYYIIMLTGTDSPDSLVSNLELGADYYLLKKPESLPELGAHINVGLRWVKAQAQLRKLATIDSLTGLSNRRALDQILEREVQVARTQGTHLSVILFDIDNFKTINDTYGHPVGDRTLRKLATIVCGEVRGSDIVTRYGGDEFVIILPGIGPDATVRVGERLCQAITTRLWPAVRTSYAGSTSSDSLRPDQFVTASIGVASFLPLELKTADELLQAADKAAYRAKQNGKNSVYLLHSMVDVELEPEVPANEFNDSTLPATYSSALEQLNPNVSVRDQALPGHLLDILQAKAAGIVQWEASGSPRLLSCAGTTPAAAARLCGSISWTRANWPADLHFQRFPPLEAGTGPDALPVAIALAVPAFDSAGRLVGGLWAAWERDVALHPLQRFLLRWLAYTLGLELELDATKQDIGIARGTP
jgi:diguanylate cyclase (GGDEF)-like protein